MEQTLGLMLAGVIAVPLLQLVKRYFKLANVPMVWIAWIFSLLLAAMTLIILGKLTLAELLADPFLLFGSGGIVMSLATIIYRTLKEKLSLG